MDRETIKGRLFGGFATKAAVCAAALFLAHEVYSFLVPVFSSINAGLLP